MEDPFPKAGVIIAEASNSAKARCLCLVEHRIAPGARAAPRLRKPMDDTLKSPQLKTCGTIAAEIPRVVKPGITGWATP